MLYAKVNKLFSRKYERNEIHYEISTTLKIDFFRMLKKIYVRVVPSKANEIINFDSWNRDPSASSEGQTVIS